MYPNVNHGFNKWQYTPRYDKAAADLAWQRTVDFLKSISHKKF
jgi:carboxymethylenebutenolidase